MSESPISPPPDLDRNDVAAAQTSESPTPTPESPTSPPPKPPFSNNQDLFSDILLWRRKQLNIAILAAATAAWVAMDVYKYNFITLLSWLAIALLTCLFLWGSIHRFLKKETPDLSELEISEEGAREQAQMLRRAAEEGIRLMFHVSCEREWFVFAGVVASLYLISLAPKYFDFVTLCYIGIVGAMFVPYVYVKNEQRIKEFAGKVEMRLRRINVTTEENLKKIKTKVKGKWKEAKEKKTE